VCNLVTRALVEKMNLTFARCRTEPVNIHRANLKEGLFKLLATNPVQLAAERTRLLVVPRSGTHLEAM
jgi:hypothetical protein